MTIPTEPIGSIPRPPALIAALATHDADDPTLEPLYAEALRDTIERFEATGSPVITDGEQRKYHNFFFIGVVSPTDPRIETPEEVRDRILEAATYVPVAQLGSTDDCGFAPFSDDTSTSRDTAFAKIRARVLGTSLAARTLGLADGTREGR